MALDSEEQSEYEELTLQTALETTLKNNLEIRNAEREINQFLKMRERASDRINMLPPGTPATTYNKNQQVLNLVQRDLAWQQKRKELEMKKDQIMYRAIEEYYQLIKEQLNESLMKDKLDLHEKLNYIQSVQYGQGVTSRIDKNVNDRELLDSEKETALASESLQGKNQELNELMRVSRNNRYVATDMPEYEPLGRFNLTGHISNVKNSSVAIWLANSQVDLVRLELSIYNIDNEFNPVPYDAAKIDEAKAQTNVTSAAEQLESTVRSAYRAITELEEQMERLEIQREIIEEKISRVSAKYSVGMATSFELEQIQFSLKEIDVQQSELIMQHELLKDLLRTPWAMGGIM